MLSCNELEKHILNYKDLEAIKNLTSNQAKILKNSSNHDSIQDLFVVHATSFFPEYGIINSRMRFQIKLDEKLKETEEIIKKLFSILRPTVHFSLNSIVSKHKDYIGTNNQRFIVIDELKKAADSISGGYVEDLFCIGPYKLSNKATILIPESEKNEISTKEKIQKISKKINISYYKGDESAALKEWLKEKNASYLNPVQKDENIPNLLGKLGKDQYISSESLMKKLGKTYCSHDITPTAQIENYIADSKIAHLKDFIISRIILNPGVEKTKKIISEYIESTKKLFKLNKNQEIFINSYEKTVLLVIDILNKKTN